MAEVKWIKLTTDMFDNRKIKHLRKLPEGNSIVLIWVMLLTMAGRCNANGMIFLTENIPYTTKMLADELGFEENLVKLALKSLSEFEMIVTDSNYLFVSGWQEHQNIEGMEKIREQTRQRVAKHREKQKFLLGTNTCQYCGGTATGIDHIIATSRGGSDAESNKVHCCIECNRIKNDKPLVDFLNSNRDRIRDDLVLANEKLKRFVTLCNVTNRYTVTECNAIEEDIEEEREEEKEIEEEREREREKINYQLIADRYNALCPSFPSIKSLSDARKKAIKARLKTYSIEEFEEVFRKAEESDFLKGRNDRNWMANFDWLIKDANMAKVLDGNYENKIGNRNTYQKQTKADELDDFYRMAAEWAEGVK